MLVRTMQKEDIKKVAEIEKASFSKPWSEKGFEDALDMNDTMLLVIEDDNMVIGYTCMYISFEEGEITNVAIEEKSRGRGLSKALMETTIAEAKKRGVTRIVLEVRKSNAPAIGLYEKMGFASLGIRKNFYEMPLEDAVIMSFE